MKTELLEYVSPLELRRVLTKLIARSGSQTEAAKRLNVTPSFLHNIMSGRANAKRKLLSYFGLEQRTVYVLKRKPQEQKLDELTACLGKNKSEQFPD